MSSTILPHFQENIWQEAGDTRAAPSGMQPPFQTGLLHLVYYLLYTKEGRTYMHDWAPDPINPARSETAVRAELKRKFSEYGVQGAAQEAMIGAHIAGFLWITAHKAGNEAERDKQEAIYKQNLAAVSWALWEQGAGELFPLGW